MRKMMFAVSLCAMTAASCKKDETKTTSRIQGTLGGKTYYVVDSGDLERSENSIKGAGSLVFSSPLAQISSKDDFLLKFTLQDSGSVELVTHSDGSLAHGVSVLLTREGTALNAVLKAKGAETAPKALGDIDAARNVALAIDVHNDEDPAHILIWNTDKDAFNEGDAVLNSENDEAAPGQGSGTAWGLILQKATLTEAVVADPKFVE